MRKVRICGHRRRLWSGHDGRCGFHALCNELHLRGMDGVHWDRSGSHYSFASYSRLGSHHHIHVVHVGVLMIHHLHLLWHNIRYQRSGLCGMGLVNALGVMHDKGRGRGGEGGHVWRLRWWRRRHHDSRGHHGMTVELLLGFNGEWLWSGDLLLQDRVQVGQLIRMRGSIVRLDTDVSCLASGLILQVGTSGPGLPNGSLDRGLHRGRHQDRGEL